MKGNDKVANQIVSVLTMHMKLFFRRGDGRTGKFHVVLPPTWLETTTAANLLAAIRQQMPATLAQLSACGDRFTLAVNSDSGRPCLKLARKLALSHTTIAAVCRMHQGCLAILAIFLRAGVLSALFCATLLLRRRRVQRMVRTKLQRHLAQNLVITYDPDDAPSDADKNHVSAALGVMDDLLAARLIEKPNDNQVNSKRIQALRRIKKNISRLGPGPEVPHHCPFGCHPSRESVVKELTDDICEVWLDHPPGVPAANKWTKLIPVMRWFSSFLALSGIFQFVMSCLSDMYDDVDLQPDEEDLVGADSTRQFLRQEAVRYKKTERFISAPAVPDKLMSCTLALKHVEVVMNKCFATSSDCGKQEGALTFVKKSSPALKCLRSLCEVLRDSGER